MASKSGSRNPIIGYRYFFSIHMGLCRGPVNELVEIKVGDKTAWTGSVTGNSTINIDAADLFGGEEKEGGVKGPLNVMMGAAAQVAPSSVKSILGGLVSNFRGVVSLFFDGLICVNNPYPKAWKMRVRRTTAGWDNDTPWYPEKAAIVIPTSATGIVHAMNPAHIIYECATNRAWGRGLPAVRLDDAAFRVAADTLFDEALGLCIRWNRQDDIDKFVQSIINHIGGVVYIDRTTGLLKLKLIRQDYNVDEVPQFDFDTGLLDITEDQSSSIDTSYNEIIVKWHNPNADQDSQARVQNLASIQSIGSTISTTVDYLGLPTTELALRIAQRDLQIQSSNLRRMTIKLDRSGGDIAPGDVFVVRAPSRGLDRIVLRAGTVTDSPLTDGAVTIQAIQDVFGLPLTSFIAPQPSVWVPPDLSATVVTTRRIEEMTYRDLVLNVTAVELAGVLDDAGTIKTLAKRPSPLAMDYVIDSAAGAEDFVERGVSSWEPVAYLTSSIDHYDTFITFDQQSDTNLVSVGVPVLIGDEYVRLDVLNTVSGLATVARGCLDTIPAPHLSGSPVWFDYAGFGGDGREYSTGETVHVKLLTRTSSFKLDPTVAPTDDILIGGRQGRPYPPGDLRVNGTPFGDFIGPSDSSVDITWAHRDRVTQADFMLEHGAGSTGPEIGTTYNVKVYDGLALLRTVTGVSSDTWTYTELMSVEDGSLPLYRFEIESERDGLVSWQKYSFLVAIQYFDTRVTSSGDVRVTSDGLNTRVTR